MRDYLIYQMIQQFSSEVRLEIEERRLFKGHFNCQTFHLVYLRRQRWLLFWPQIHLTFILMPLQFILPIHLNWSFSATLIWSLCDASRDIFPTFWKVANVGAVIGASAGKIIVFSWGNTLSTKWSNSSREVNYRVSHTTDDGPLQFPTLNISWVFIPE